MLQREQIDYLLVHAYNAAVRAGARILEIYGSDDFFIDIKADNTPVTLADNESHTIIKKHLGQTRIPVMSEEGRDLLHEERCNWDLFWLVDPLDGTKEFIRRKSHEFTVNIALMVDHKPFLGVIYVPWSRKMYFSDMERGAYLKAGVEPDPEASCSIARLYDGAEQLPLSKKRNHPLRIAVSRFHKSPETEQAIESLRKRYGEIEVIETGSSLKFCMVAEGSADLHIRATHTFEWDTAAGEAIASAAGALTETLDGNMPLLYNKKELTNPYFYCKSKFIR